MKKFLATILLATMLVGCSTAEPEAPVTPDEDIQDVGGEVSGISGSFDGVGAGHAGDIAVTVTLENNIITAVDVTTQNETPGLGDVAITAITELMVENNTVNVDSIAGATNSSSGVKAAVTAALLSAGMTQGDIDEMQAVSKEVNAPDSEMTYDVVIVGAGGAGLSAAVEAAQGGASVVVLEKTSFSGGNTLVSGGGLNIPGTDIQIAHDVTDSVESFIADTLSGGDNINNVALVEVMGENALDAYNWLVEDIGVEFMQDRMQQFGGHSVPRAVIPVGNKGTEMISKLEVVARDLGVDIYMNTEATELTMTDGVVTGLKALNDGNDITVTANNGVILATGGFAANVEMRMQYNPAYGEKYKTTSVPASTGDGIVMAQAVGAGLVDMEQIQVYPTCNPNTGIISYVGNSRFDGAILINKEGERFINEMGRRDHISNAILEQTDEVGYLVWGQEIETVGNMTEVHSVEFNTMLNEGTIFKVETLEEAAESFGIDVETFTSTIETFNGYVADGTDPDFGKTGAYRTIAQGPFYIQKVVPATHHTMGGITINTDAEVLDTNGEVIEGLYAAGEVTGGIHGTNRLGGNAITDIVVFGRIAGQNIVK